MPSQKREFEPTTTWLIEALVRARACGSQTEAEQAVNSSALAVGVDPATLREVDEFIQLCAQLKKVGGLVEFVAIMATTTATFYRSTQQLRGE